MSPKQLRCRDGRTPGGFGDPADAISGETTEHTALYPGFATQAARDRCRAAAKLFTDAAADEGGHEAAFKTALRSLINPSVMVPPPPQVSPAVITASYDTALRPSTAPPRDLSSGPR